MQEGLQFEGGYSIVVVHHEMADTLQCAPMSFSCYITIFYILRQGGLLTRVLIGCLSPI